MAAPLQHRGVSLLLHMFSHPVLIAEERRALIYMFGLQPCHSLEIDLYMRQDAAIHKAAGIAQAASNLGSWRAPSSNSQIERQQQHAKVKLPALAVSKADTDVLSASPIPTSATTKCLAGAAGII